MKKDMNKLPKILGSHPKDQQSLIAVLQDIQKEYNYLPADALKQVAEYLSVPLSKVFSVSTFYNAFSLTPKGDSVIKVCMGTTCHIRGAGQILEQLEKKLNIHAGETTPDLKYSIEVVNCVGACSMAPVVIVNDKYYGSVKISDTKKLLRGG
ncbi:MAG: NAD(P)H-dependent oxidoreductase subunit E [candidate division Zixibacteria bacterium]|nr:NAD(P)H-dependent oxidoreductase subunit E [candidate division Zixibacteria bacterium]